MAKRFNKRRVCEGGFNSKRDALAEAATIRRIGHKASVKKNPRGGYFVCRTYRMTKKR